MFKNDLRNLDQHVSIPLPGSLFDPKHKSSVLEDGDTNLDVKKYMLLNYNKNVYGTKFVPKLRGHSTSNKRKRKKKLAILKSNHEFGRHHRPMRLKERNRTNKSLFQNLNQNGNSGNNVNNWSPTPKLNIRFEGPSSASQEWGDTSTKTYFNQPDFINAR